MTPTPRHAFSNLELFIALLIFAVLMTLGGWGRIIPSGETVTRSRVSRARADMRSVAQALEDYRVEHSAWPPSRPHPTAPERNAIAFGALPDTHAPADRDPFSLERSQPYAYFAFAGGWALASAGPDEDYDFDPAHLYRPGMAADDPALAPVRYDPTNGAISNGDVWRFWEPPAPAGGIR